MCCCRRAAAIAMHRNRAWSRSRSTVSVPHPRTRAYTHRHSCIATHECISVIVLSLWMLRGRRVGLPVAALGAQRRVQQCTPLRDASASTQSGCCTALKRTTMFQRVVDSTLLASGWKAQRRAAASASVSFGLGVRMHAVCCCCYGIACIIGTHGTAATRSFVTSAETFCHLLAPNTISTQSRCCFIRPRVRTG